MTCWDVGVEKGKSERKRRRRKQDKKEKEDVGE